MSLPSVNRLPPGTWLLARFDSETGEAVAVDHHTGDEIKGAIAVGCVWGNLEFVPTDLSQLKRLRAARGSK